MICSYIYKNLFVNLSESYNLPDIDIFTHLLVKSDFEPFTIYRIEIPTFAILVPEALQYFELISCFRNILSHKFWLYIRHNCGCFTVVHRLLQLTKKY